MAYSRTLAELEEAVRREADMVNSQFVTSAEVRAYINQSWAELYDRIVLFDQEYLLRYVDITSTGAGEYDLLSNAQTGIIRSIQSIANAGSAYVNGSTVPLVLNGNSTASASITTSGASNSIASMTLTNGGSGYQDAAATSVEYALTSAIDQPNTNIPGNVVPVIVNSELNLFAIAVDFSVTPSVARFVRYNTVTGTVDYSNVLTGGANVSIAYHTPSQTLIGNGSDGRFHTCNPLTMVATSTNTTASLWREGIYIDPATNWVYMATASEIKALTYPGFSQNASLIPSGGVERLLAFASNIPPFTVSKLFYVSSVGEQITLKSVPPTLGTPTALATFTSVAQPTGVWAVTPKRLFISSDSNAWYYDYDTGQLVSIAPTLNGVQGYVLGRSVISYDDVTNRVWFGSVPQTTALVAVDATTGQVSATANIPASAVFTSAAYVSGAVQKLFVPRVLVAGNPATISGQSFYLYTSASVSVPNNIITLSVGGGLNGTVKAYVESDFYKCKGVWYGTNGEWSPLRRFNWDEQNALRQADLYSGIAALPLYRIYTIAGREKLGIAPDTLKGTYRVYYYPAPQKMLVSTDRIDGRSGWDEWVIKDAAMKCLLKEESIEQAAAIKAVRDELFQRFQLHASERDASQPERIRNVRLLSRNYGHWR